MKAQYKFGLAVIVGAALGAAVTRGLQAQNTPPAYFIAEVTVTDAETFKGYAAAVPATIEKYGGKYMARGGNTKALEGEPPKRIIITAFKSMGDAVRWYDSPEYSPIKSIRLRSAKSRGFIVEGVGP
jgi:uncharacterized protein (DUF1330 family)